jgi:hypothetical protein
VQAAVSVMVQTPPSPAPIVYSPMAGAITGIDAVTRPLAGSTLWIARFSHVGTQSAPKPASGAPQGTPATGAEPIRRPLATS